MSDEKYGFCPHCGHELTEDCRYCPDCGAVLEPLSGSDAYQSRPLYAGPTGKDRPMDSQFLLSFVLLTAYSLIMILSALSCMFFADATVSAMADALAQSGMTWEEFMSSVGLNMTQSEFTDIMQIAGGYMLIAVLPAAASTVLCFMRRKHAVASAAAGIATLMVFVSTLMMGSILSAVIDSLIGAVVTYMLYKNCRDYFVD